MKALHSLLVVGTLGIVSSLPASAFSPEKGAITGAGDPGAQVVVTQVDGGKVIDAMVKCDGTYRAEGLEPGRYQIVEGGPHHAPRTLTVRAGEDSHVDLAPQASIKSTCH